MNGSTKRERLTVVLVLALFALASLVHTALLPLFEGPDEGDNLSFVRFLVLERRLPQPTVEVSPELENLGRGHMPPLWFLSLTPLAAAMGGPDWVPTAPLNPAFLRLRGTDGSGATAEQVLRDPRARLHYLHGADEQREWSGAALDLRLLRLTTLPFALLLLWATWRAGRLLFPERPDLALGAMALLAATPQLQHLSGTLTMDLMLAAWGALCTWALLVWCVGTSSAWKAALAAGLCAGLAGLTKLNGLVLWPLLPCAAWLARANGRAGATALLAATAGLLCSAGPFYLWGWIESGHPLWSWHYQTISPFHTGGLTQGAGLGLLAGDWGETLRRCSWFGAVLFLSWLADFGWTAVWFPTWVVVGCALLYLCGAAGWLAALWRARRASLGGERPRLCRAALLLLSCGAVLILTAELGFNLYFSQPQARHLYPLLSCMALCLAAGLARWRLLWPAVVLHLLLSVGGVWLLSHWLRPEGWNQDPRFSATDDARRAVPQAQLPPTAVDAPAWLEPAPQARLSGSDPILLRWQARPGSLCDLVVAVDNPSFEHRPWKPQGHVFRALTQMPQSYAADSGQVLLPASFWAELPPGTRVQLQVLELDADGSTRARSGVLELCKGP